MASQITVITGTGSASYTVSTGARGPAGAAGSDAEVTSQNIATALGYTPADDADIPVVDNAAVNAAIAESPGTSRAALGGDLVVYARDYGTVNNVADSAIAINLAILAADASDKPFTVQLPPGEIRIATPITLANRVALRGMGSERTTITQASSGVNGITLPSTSPAEGLSGIQLEGFTLIGPTGWPGDGLTTGVGVFLDDPDHVGLGGYTFYPVLLSDVSIYRWNTCLRVTSIPIFRAVHCNIQGWQKYGVHLVSTDTFIISNCHVGCNPNPPYQMAATGDRVMFRLEGSLNDPDGLDDPNFAGLIVGGEFGPCRKYLEMTRGRLVFDSCNFENRTDLPNNVPESSRSPFDLSGLSYFSMRDSRVSFAATYEAGADPASVIRVAAVEANGIPTVAIINSGLTEGATYPVGATSQIAAVGADFRNFTPVIIGNKAYVNWYNASNTLITTSPYCLSSPVVYDYNFWVQNRAGSLTAFRGLWGLNMAPDATYTADDSMVMTRLTRKRLAGVRQYAGVSMVNADLMEVLAASITAVNNAAGGAWASFINYNVQNGQFLGAGDLLHLQMQGVFAANANTKSVRILTGPDLRATFAVSSATAVVWELNWELFATSASTTAGLVKFKAWDSSGVEVFSDVRRTTAGGWNADQTVVAQGSSSGASDITMERYNLVWRSSARTF